MFSLLESELSRGIVQAARTKLRTPSSPCPPRRSVADGSRPCSSHGAGKLLDKDVPSGNVKGRTLSMALAGDYHPSVQLTFVRGYASAGSPSSHGSSGPASGQLPVGVNIQDFMQARPFEEIPGPTAIHQSIPFAGTRLLYYPFTNYPAENMSDLLNKLQATHGPIMRVKFGNEWVVIVERLADIERVVRAAEEEYGSTRSTKPESYGLLNSLRTRVGDSALSWLGWNGQGLRLPKEASDGVPIWILGNPQTQKLRADIARHLNSQLTVAGCLVKQEDMANQLVKCLEQVQSNAESMQTLFYRYSIECVTQMCFNYRLGLLNEPVQNDESMKKLVESYRTVVKCLGETMTGTRVLHMLFEDPFAKRFKESKQIVIEWEQAMIRGEVGGGCPETVLDKAAKSGSKSAENISLLRTLQEEKNLNQEEIGNALHALMTIGADSVASTLQMLLYALATNTESQVKLAAEIDKVLGSDSALNPNALDSMEYLKAAIKESLRLHFPMAAGGRVVLSKNIVLHDYLIPSHTPIVVNSRRTAKNPKWFDHPHHFKPERWIGEEAKKIPTLAYMPFGFGANHCPSRAFSLQELNVAIVKILQKFKVNLPVEYQHKPLETTYALFRSPKQPLPFYFTPRGEPGAPMPKCK